MMKVISLGLGVQSTALYYMSSLNQLPRADYAIFSDLGREGKKTYHYLDYLLDWQKKNNGIQIIIRTEKNLYNDLITAHQNENRFASIPAYTENENGKEGMLRRQCTGEYKIQVVDNAIRDLYGLPPRARRPKTEVWHGITLDEMDRMSFPREKWKINQYPFIGYAATNDTSYRVNWGKRMERHQVMEWYLQNNLPIPPKSSCVFCPYRSDAAWLKMKNEDPEDFHDAVKVDQMIRHLSNKGLQQPIYLHRSLLPLDQVTFNSQLNIDLGECSGNCHV